MQKYDIHVCLVSAQAAANLLPILDNEFKAKQVILMISPEMKKNAENLEKVFITKGIKVINCFLSNVFEFSQLEQEMLDLLDNYTDENIALNVTGGTKLMAIAAQTIFSMMSKPIFYLDTDHNRIVFITKDENNQRIEDLALNTKIDVETYLQSYGGKLVKCQKNPSPKLWLDFAERFITHYEIYKKAIPALNYIGKTTQKLTNKVEQSEATDILLDLNDEGIVKFNKSELDFKTEQTKFFLTGGWLEELTYRELQDIKHINDLKCNVEVGNSQFNSNKSQFEQSNLGNQNEFDIAFMAKNKLHIIECKTQDMSRKSEDILYKLETLKDYGGFMTKKCLVTYLRVPPQVQNRAKTLNIEIIQGEDLQQLKAKIQNWIGKK